MKFFQCLRNLALAAMLLSTGVANAGLFQFQVTGDYEASWQIDSDWTPDVVAPGEGFVYYDIPGFADAFFGVADITFFHGDIGGGLQIEDFYGGTFLLSTDGPQLYSGSEDSPLFLAGVYDLTEYLGSGTYVLTITDLDVPPGEVPEPATGALLIGGLGLLIAARKRRHAK